MTIIIPKLNKFRKKKYGKIKNFLLRNKKIANKQLNIIQPIYIFFLYFYHSSLFLLFYLNYKIEHSN